MSKTASDIASAGAGFYFAPETLEKGKEAGLDGFRLYFLGRGGVMGDVNAKVVQSAFGYFNPELLTSMWTTGTETMPAREVAAMYWECAADFGRRKLADVEGLGEYCAAAEAILNATECDGLPLFAGIMSMPLAEDLPARAYQLMAVLRELRGSAHLAAIRAAGLTPREAHAFKRPEMLEMFGWTEDFPIGEDVEAKLDQAEKMTDAALECCYSTLDEAAEQAFIAGTKAITEACTA